MRRRRLLALGATAALPLLSGCSVGDDSDGDPTSPGTSTPTDGGTGTPTAGRGDTDSSPATNDSRTPTDGGSRALAVTSTAFADGGSIPTAHTCSGAGRSPPLTVGGVPDAAATLALIVDDPDAPREEPFVHWLVWNVPADRTEWPAEVSAGERAPELADAPQGRASTGDLGYVGPCPPEGDGPHRYRFTMFAVEGSLDLRSGAERSALKAALEGRVLARGRLVGTYERG